MEVNRDEAEHCIEIALEAVNKGNIDRAERFLTKANNLYPTLKSKELLTKLKTYRNNNKRDTNNDNNNRNSSSSPSRNFSSATEQTVPPSPVNYSTEQLAIVRKIKSTSKDYYKVLGVTKDSNDTEIKKSYKKLALQLHPDKNHAPGSVEAFKIIGTAAATLTDPEKRKTYDLYCNDNNENLHSYSRSHHHQHQQNAHHYQFNNNNYDFDRSSFESAEEFINMFFSGGGFQHQRGGGGGTGGSGGSEAGNGNTNNRARYQARHEAGQPSLAFGLILVLIAISMMSSFFTSDPIYSLAQSSRYSIQKKTNHLNIPYYVKEKFDTEYQGSLPRLENSVKEDYISTMKQACYREKSYREVMIVRAKSFGNQIHLEQAINLKTPSCDSLNRLGFSLSKFF